MMSRPTILSLSGAFILAGCATLGTAPNERLGSAELKTSSNVPAGTVQLLRSGDRVTLTAIVAGLPAGAHGMHLHMVGACDGPGFTSAGAHLNPHGKQHGTDNPAGSHLGDLPNLQVSQLGAATLTAELKGSPAEIDAALFDADGTALVIHASRDDYRTDPTGNSGDRIACGVINKR